MTTFMKAFQTGDNSQFDIGNTAFDSKSVNGAYDWLLSLSPPVLEGVGETAKGKNFRNATFTRRTHCSPALFLMGLSWVVLGRPKTKFGDSSGN